MPVAWEGQWKNLSGISYMEHIFSQANPRLYRMLSASAWYIVRISEMLELVLVVLVDVILSPMYIVLSRGWSDNNLILFLWWLDKYVASAPREKSSSRLFALLISPLWCSKPSSERVSTEESQPWSQPCIVSMECPSSRKALSKSWKVNSGIVKGTMSSSSVVLATWRRRVKTLRLSDVPRCSINEQVMASDGRYVTC